MSFFAVVVLADGDVISMPANGGTTNATIMPVSTPTKRISITVTPILATVLMARTA